MPWRIPIKKYEERRDAFKRIWNSSLVESKRKTKKALGYHNGYISGLLNGRYKNTETNYNRMKEIIDTVLIYNQWYSKKLEK